MKKLVVYLVCIVLLLCFGWVVHYALRHSRGVPVVVSKPLEKTVIEVPFIDKEINLDKDISSEPWENIDFQKLEMMYQATVLPWPKKLVSSINVKAFHNKEDIYFYLKWPDNTEDRTLGQGQFSDACAIMFPLGKKVQPASIMMGFLGKANIWQWKASQDREFWTGENPQPKTYADFYYPFEKEELFVVTKQTPTSAVNDLLAIRVGTITPKPVQYVEGKGLFDKGFWHVVFKRSLETLELETSPNFESGQKRQSVFAVWNGANGDRGGRKSLSEWAVLEIK